MNLIAIGLTLGLIVVTVLISYFVRTFNKTTTDFYLAGRQLNYFTNASAILGDYFSAASFLGVAGAVYASGLDGVWFGTGFGAAFLPVLFFFASPIRRFGEFTLPDFFAARFQASSARLVAVIAVQAVCLFYLAPQMVGAGQVWELLVRRGYLGLSPYATGVWVTVLVMAFYVSVGGMKGTTWNQLLQFWIRMAAMLFIAGAVFIYGFSYAQALAEVSQGPLTAPAAYRVADLKRPAAGGPAPLAQAQALMDPDYWAERVVPRLADDSATVVVLMPVQSQISGRPMTFSEPGGRYNRLDQFSVVLALILGTSGLPHIMNRYYTASSGKSARWTTVGVLIGVAVFYTAASVVGAAGRAMVPTLAHRLSDPALLQHLVSGVLTESDLIVPFLAQSLGGQIGLGFVVAGAFAAMFSVIGGLLIASAASWAHDLYEQYADPDAPQWKRVAVGKLAVLGMSLVSLLIGLAIPKLGLTRAYPALIALMVTWAFAVAGGALTPALFTAIWWKKVTLKGALVGMIIGGGGSILFIVLNMLTVTRVLSPDSLAGRAGQLVFPSIFTVPASLVAIYVVSLLDQHNLPTNIDEIWMRIHGTARERAARLAEREARRAAAPPA